MSRKGVIFFIIMLNIICLAYGIMALMWEYYGPEVIAANVINLVSLIYFTVIMTSSGGKKRAVTVGFAALTAFYGIIYLVFQNAFTPVSFIIVGSFYGLTANIMRLASIGSQSLHTAVGISFLVMAAAVAGVTATVCWSYENEEI
ncbi:MAG: hypothetical protein ACI4LP_08565 [Anaerovoracaceae bacterium]